MFFPLVLLTAALTHSLLFASTSLLDYCGEYNADTVLEAGRIVVVLYCVTLENSFIRKNKKSDDPIHHAYILDTHRHTELTHAPKKWKGKREKKKKCNSERRIKMKHSTHSHTHRETGTHACTRLDTTQRDIGAHIVFVIRWSNVVSAWLRPFTGHNDNGAEWTRRRRRRGCWWWIQ